jgi:hypothetical protein
VPGWLLLAFAVVGLVVYAPALHGSFISDDEHYVERNVFVHAPLENLGAILDPTSVLAVIVENYAPVHILLHALEWQLFGPATLGYHVVNVLVHALASFLLVLLLRRSGVSRVAAMLGGAFFLVHPANVEAVAWINQLKTSSAMVLCLGALILHPRRPALAALTFALALMAKPTAAVALFVAAAFGWAHGRPREAGARESGANEEGANEAGASERAEAWRWGWLGVQAAILVLFAIAEFAAFGQTAGQAPTLYVDLGDRIRGILAAAMRYLVMAASSYGLSAFHEPDPAGPFDPWWLASLPVLAAIGWRFVTVLRARRAEAAWWLFAVVSFAPICGLIPLPFPIADRYLYFILPGLLGGVLLAGPDMAGWLGARLGVAPDARVWRTLRIAAALVIVVFAVRSFDRAAIWRAPATVMADAMQNYPDGVAAKTHLATRAAQAGDAAKAVSLLEAANDRGYNRLDHLLLDHYAPIQNHAAFVELKKQWARVWIERLSLPRARNASPSQHELQLIAQAQLVLGDLDAARDTIVRAIERGGPLTSNLEVDLAEVERAIRFSRLRSPQPRETPQPRESPQP